MIYFDKGVDIDMTLKELISLQGIFFAIMSIVLIRYSIKNESKNNCKFICIVDIAYAIYSIINFVFYLCLDFGVGFEIFLMIPIIIVSEILLIISFIISFRKMKKTNKISGIKDGIYIVLAFLLFPIIGSGLTYSLELEYLNNSKLILVLRDSGNGGFGDTEYIAYGIGDGHCNKISIGTDFNGYRIDDYFVEPAKKLKIERDLDEKCYTLLESNYSIKWDKKDPGRLYIYEGNLCIVEIDVGSNISLERAFLRY